MFFAGHCPTHHFGWAEWFTMPIDNDPDSGLMPSHGWSRSRDSRGKPVCVFFDWATMRGYAVRPIVRVKMGRRVVSDAQQTIYEWFSRGPSKRMAVSVMKQCFEDCKDWAV